MAHYCRTYIISQINLIYERNENLKPGVIKIANNYGEMPAFKTSIIPNLI